MKNYTLQNISIGLDVSKETISVYIPINKLDYEINNTFDGLKKLTSKLKKLYKKECNTLVFVYEPTGSYSELLKSFVLQKVLKLLLSILKGLTTLLRRVEIETRLILMMLDYCVKL